MARCLKFPNFTDIKCLLLHRWSVMVTWHFIVTLLFNISIANVDYLTPFVESDCKSYCFLTDICLKTLLLSEEVFISYESWNFASKIHSGFSWLYWIFYQITSSKIVVQMAQSESYPTNKAEVKTHCINRRLIPALRCYVESIKTPKTLPEWPCFHSKT